MKFIPIIFIALIPTFVWADDLYTNDIIGGCGDAYYYSAEFEPISYTCLSGQFLPAGAISCQSCPNGYTCNGGTFTFNANQTQGISEGDILVTNAIGSCSTQFNQNFSAIFEPITYTCTLGYYLPAGVDECTVCPEHTVCSGGTYTFNETTVQGITGCETGYNLQNNECVGNTITITWDDGTNTIQNTCDYDGDVTLPPTPTRPGYVFSGWKVKTSNGEN